MKISKSTIQLIINCVKYIISAVLGALGYECFF